MEEVLIGFGSNQGDPAKICREATGMLCRHPRIEDCRISSLYRTAPIGPIEQPWFVNGALFCRTDLEPEELLKVLNDIENAFGRVRDVRWGPRTLDLDLLFYGSREIVLPHLIVPHPRLHERRFVLEPLAEIASQWVHPVLKETVLNLLNQFLNRGPEQAVERWDAQ